MIQPSVCAQFNCRAVTKCKKAHMQIQPSRAQGRLVFAPEMVCVDQNVSLVDPTRTGPDSSDIGSTCKEHRHRSAPSESCQSLMASSLSLPSDTTSVSSRPSDASLTVSLSPPPPSSADSSPQLSASRTSGGSSCSTHPAHSALFARFHSHEACSMQPKRGFLRANGCMASSSIVVWLKVDPCCVQTPSTTWTGLTDQSYAAIIVSANVDSQVRSTALGATDRKQEVLACRPLLVQLQRIIQEVADIHLCAALLLQRALLCRQVDLQLMRETLVAAILLAEACEKERPHLSA